MCQELFLRRMCDISSAISLQLNRLWRLAVCFSFYFSNQQRRGPVEESPGLIGVDLFFELEKFTGGPSVSA